MAKRKKKDPMAQMVMCLGYVAIGVIVWIILFGGRIELGNPSPFFKDFINGKFTYQNK